MDVFSGVLLGVALRHGITPNLHMSSYFWRVLSKASLSPYTPPTQYQTQGPAGQNNSNNSSCSKAGRRSQELFSGVREACARSLRHGVASVLPEVCMLTVCKLSCLLVCIFDLSNHLTIISFAYSFIVSIFVCVFVRDCDYYCFRTSWTCYRSRSSSPFWLEEVPVMWSSCGPMLHTESLCWSQTCILR